MEIATKLRLNTAVTVIVAVAIGLVLIFLDQEAQRLRGRSAGLENVAQSVLRLNNLTLDYLLHPGTRDMMQWNMTYDGVTKIVSAVVPENAEERAIMRDMMTDQGSIKVLFTRLVDLETARSRGQGRDIVAGQLLLKTQAVVSAALQLERAGDRRLLEARRLSSLAIIVLILGLSLVLVVSGWRLSRGIMGPLQQLRDGAEKVGRGDLRFRIGLNTRDEIGELARRFDAMTQSLAQGQARRNEAETELRNASLYARSLIEASLDPLVTISDQGKIMDVNHATEEATGLAREQLIGTDFASYFTDSELARAGYRQVLQKGYVRDYPLTLRHMAGSTMDVLYNASLYRDEAGEVQGVFAAARDVTELNLTIERLRHSERSLAEAQRMAHLGNWHLDLVNNTLAWSEEIYRIFEIDPEKFGASYDAFLDAIHPDDRDRVNKAYTDSVANKTPYDIVHRLLMKDGRVKYVNERCRTDYDEAGKPLHSIGTVHDITERVLAENEIRELNRDLERRVIARTAQLEDANTELEAFAYSVSHDLRTPLRAIDGFSRILLEDYENTLDAEGKRLLNVVRDNTVKMAQLIDDILQFSRTGRQEMVMADIDMEQLAREVVGELTPAAEGRDLRIEIQPMPKVRGDRNLLHQVLSNLIANAIKFTHKREAAVIGVAGRREGNEHIYSVKDNGAGFDMQYVDKLFGVFQRLHTVEEFEGTGIGLAIVKRIVTRHGGRVWAESVLNEGATFHFALPAKEVEHA